MEQKWTSQVVGANSKCVDFFASSFGLGDCLRKAEPHNSKQQTREYKLHECNF